MRIVIHESADAVAEFASSYIIERINDFAPTKARPFVIGLPTGSTPLKTYQRLITAYREGRVSFKNVVSFNMDEYVGLPKDHPESYHSFMRNNFFSFIDIPKENVNILDGNAADLLGECQRFEDKIVSVGGIELFMGGVGTDGHIAFNEPGSSLASRTRVKSLNQETIASNARFFDNDISKVPTMALTVGVQTVMDARSVLIIATGTNKANAVAQCVEGAMTHNASVTALQAHRFVTLAVDDDATLDLRVKTVRYFKGLTRREKDLTARQRNVKRLRDSSNKKLSSKL